MSVVSSLASLSILVPIENMAASMTTQFASAVLGQQARTARPSRRSVAVRAGAYDAELIETAVSGHCVMERREWASAERHAGRCTMLGCPFRPLPPMWPGQHCDMRSGGVPAPGW